MRLSQKPLKEWNHKDTKTQSFFRASSSSARKAGKKVFLCAFVSLWFKAFMLFATISFVRMSVAANNKKTPADW